MKKLLFTLLITSITTISFAQKKEGNKFTPIYDIETTKVKSQGNTGTCWSFSASSFIESEIFRKKGIVIDISEMYSVRNTYEKKAENYILRQGKAQFSEGSLAHDVMNAVKENGLVPEVVYAGNVSLTGIHDHAEMFKALDTLVNSFVKTPKVVQKNWSDATNSVLDKYLGKEPNSFKFDNKIYTPKSFQKAMDINPEDYVTLTSFTHHPYYETFILEIPDNFSNGAFYNLPLDEYVSVIEYALSKGYTVALDTDVSEKSFSSKSGMATLPKEENNDSAGVEKKINLSNLEKVVTPENRQTEFLNYNTTDDHLMHITGLLKDQQGNKYYKVKNSWGTMDRGNGGYVYMSVPYTQMKSISLMLHKDGIPAELREKLDL